MYSVDRSRLSLRVSVVAILLSSAWALAPADAETNAEGKTAVATARSDACGVKLAKPLLGYWSCTFVDNFNGTTVDTTKWNLQDTSVSGFVLGRTCFEPGVNTKVANGTLRLSVSKTATPFTCKSPYGDFQTQYVGADINTYGKFRQPYGRYEARLKYPTPNPIGYHGGFWMNPQDRVYGVWPLSGEIDAAEWWSSTPDHVYPSLHYLGSTINDTGWNCVIGDPAQFHTYAVEWTLTDIKFIYDGTTCFSRSLTSILLLGGVMPFDQRFFLSLTFGEGAPVAPSNDATPFPATMTVDYVKVWA